MRLIDADALEKELKKDIMGGLNYRWYINNAPTVCDIEQIRAEIMTKTPCSLCRFRDDKSGICDMCPAMPLERGAE